MTRPPGKRRNVLGTDTPAPPGGPSSDGSGVDGLTASSAGGPGGEGENRAESLLGTSANVRPLASMPGGAARLRAPPDPEYDLACAKLPLTDLGNAERWRIRFGDDFRFCPEIGWFYWDARRWRLLSEEKDRMPAEVMQAVFLTVRAIRNEAALVASSGCPPTVELTGRELDQFEAFADAFRLAERDSYLRGDENGERARWLEALEPMDIVLGAKQRAMWSHKIAAWAKTSEGVGKINAVAGLAKSFPAIAIRPDALDRDRMAINVFNGTLRLERAREKRSSAEIEAGKSEWHTVGWRVKRMPHDRGDLITKLAPVKYAPAATCPAFDQFMLRVQPDPLMRRFLCQWGGYSLVGDTTEHKMAFFHGAGRNGKGTWVEALAHLAGDYAGAIGIESLLDGAGQRRGDQATPDLAELPGVRFLRVSEPPKGVRFNDGLIKQLSGGDPVKARFLNKGFFTFFPDFKLTVSGNSKPVVKDLSHGMWSRMQLVPWDQVIPEDEIDRGLGERLKGEASGILNLMLAGLIDWREHGMIVPEQVASATRKYRDDSDELGRFLSELCEVADDARVRIKASELFDFYQAWAAASSLEAWKQRGFVNAMREKGFEQKTSNGIWWVKLRVRSGIGIEDVRAGSWRERLGAVSDGAENADFSRGDDDDRDPFIPDDFDG